MVREVLPNVLPAMFSIALLAVAVVIVAEGGLSILGVGVLPPAVSWGNMIANSRADLQTLPYEVFEPIICIFLTVLSLNYLGDIVRARTRRSGECTVSSAAPPGRAAERFADAPLDGPLLEVEGVKTFFKTPRGLVACRRRCVAHTRAGQDPRRSWASRAPASRCCRARSWGCSPSNVERHGSIKFEGREIGNAGSREMRSYWGTQMSMVFQDPMTSLNPVMKIGKQITEPLLLPPRREPRLRARHRAGAAAVGRDPRSRTPARRSTPTNCRVGCGSG